MLDAILLARNRCEGSRRAYLDNVVRSDRRASGHHRGGEPIVTRAPAAAAIFPTSRQASPYIHLERDTEGRLTNIRQRREGDRMPDVGESDMGLFSLSASAYTSLLPQFRRRSQAGERHRREKFSAFPAVAVRSRTPRADISVHERDRGNRHQHAGRSPPARGLSARPGEAVKRLSIVIPAYNEERFIGTLLERIRAVDLTPHGLEKELMVVDDCSKDGTVEIVKRYIDVVLCRHERNGGKGRAVRTGIARHRRLPDDPDADLVRAPRLRADGQGAAIEAGGRGVREPLHERPVRQQACAADMARLSRRQSLSIAALLCTGRYLTDTVTALKLFPRPLLNELDLQTSGFELDHEITSKVLARGCRIVEVPIQYFPRSREGKEDRRKGLAQGTADVLAISPGINAIHAPSSRSSRLCSTSAGTKPSALEMVSRTKRSPSFDGTVSRSVTPGIS